MPDFTIASFNVKNLIGPDREYYRFQSYTPEEYAWKRDWLAGQLLKMDADIVGFQEIFEADALRDVVDETQAQGAALNARAIPDETRRYRHRAVFRKLAFDGYGQAALHVAANTADTGEPGQRRPGVALLSRFGFAAPPRIVQDLDPPLVIPFPALRGTDGDAGHYRLNRLSRPILIAQVPVGARKISVITCHLKSKLGEFICPEDADFAPEEDLTEYDPLGRAMGSLRSALRRMAEAWVLRREVLAELATGNPLIVLGDFNDGEHAVSSEMIAGEVPFKNYSWIQRHDATEPGQRYSRDEDRMIQQAIRGVRLHSAEKLFVRKSLRDMVYTSAFGGNYESIDQIFLSAHFDPENPDRIGGMDYFSVFNDHLTDGSHPEAPYNKLASDHGQIMAHLRLADQP